jgi:hypothetical protein
MMEVLAMRYGNKSVSVKQNSNVYIVEMFENSKLIGTLRTIKFDEAREVADEYVSEGAKPQFLSE